MLLVVDASASMRQGERMNEARKLALEKLEKLDPAATRVGLIAFDQMPQVKLAPTADLPQVRAALDELKAGYGATGLVAALQRADQLLQADEFKDSLKEVVVIGDFQRSGWAAYDGEWRLSAGVDLALRPVTHAVAANVAITQVSMPRSTVLSPRPEALNVRISNFGAERKEGVKVVLAFNGAAVEEKLVNLRPNNAEIVRFRHVFDQPGDSFGTIAVEGQDACPEDDIYHFNVRVLPRIQVLVVNGGAAMKKSEDDAFFLRAALSVEGSPFEVRPAEPDRVKPTDLEGADAVILTNVNRLPGGMEEALLEFLGRGKGVLLFPGDRVTPEDFNASFSKLAPCRLKEVVHYPRGGDGVPVAEVDFTHRVFRLFAAPQSGEFSRARYFEYFMVTDSQAAQVRARYLDGRPALLEREFPGGGICLLFTSSAGLKWNDFARQGGLFVPFMHEAVRYLAVRGEAITTAQVGQPLVLAVEAKGGELTPAEGEKIALAAGSQSFVPTRPGLHVLTQGEQIERFAVNLDPEESDPAVLDPEEIRSAVSSNPAGSQVEIEGAKVLVAASGEVRERIEKGQAWGWYLLILLLLGLVGEHLLANHTSRN
ncbi:MAG: VWA domain-containing protein [Planctomycetota bacterium]|nr:VWA domain-containing protein [Planctomycetota bacterium]